jgi:hypothetical protein
MEVLIQPTVKTSRGNRGTIAGTSGQIKVWREKRRKLGLTDAELLSYVLPLLDQIKGVRDANN